MSSHIQNEIIDIIGNLRLVLYSILDSVKKQGCMCSALTKSQCLMGTGEIREEFLSFIKMADGSAESIF